MYSREEIITPKMAAEYLKKNENNRPAKLEAIRKYAKDMKEGRWEFSDQGISFREDGTLANGQNRLEAIIRANIPVRMYVTYDVPNSTNIYDRCVKRSCSDTLHMMGYRGASATNLGVGTINFLFSLAGTRNASDSIISEFIEENHINLNTAVLLVGKGAGQTRICKKAVIAAAAFCALTYGVPEDALERFFVVANSGFQNNELESSAIVLRNYMLQDYSTKDFSCKRSAFVTATNAIRDFSNAKPRTRRYDYNADAVYWATTRKTKIDKYIK